MWKSAKFKLWETIQNNQLSFFNKWITKKNKRWRGRQILLLKDPSMNCNVHISTGSWFKQTLPKIDTWDNRRSYYWQIADDIKDILVQIQLCLQKSSYLLEDENERTVMPKATLKGLLKWGHEGSRTYAHLQLLPTNVSSSHLHLLTAGIWMTRMTT